MKISRFRALALVLHASRYAYGLIALTAVVAATVTHLLVPALSSWVLGFGVLGGALISSINITGASRMIRLWLVPLFTLGLMIALGLALETKAAFGVSWLSFGVALVAFVIASVLATILQMLTVSTWWNVNVSIDLYDNL